MKTKISIFIALTVLGFSALACSVSFTTANLSSLNFGKNNTATPPTTTFDVGEKVYAVATVANAMGKYKMKFKLTFENVQGKSKGETAANQDLDIEGSGSPTFFFTPPVPGEYKVEATLVDENGKEIGKKSGTVTVKGTAPASNNSTDKDHDTDQHDGDENKSHE